MQRLSQISDQYERLVQENALTWVPVDKMTLAPTTVLYLSVILDPSGLEYLMAEQRLDRTVLFKVDHPTIRYLHHDPVTDSHMWAGEGFAEALPNDKVLAVLAVLAESRPRRLMDGIFALLRGA